LLFGLRFSIMDFIKKRSGEREMKTLSQKITELKNAKNAVILAHYYQTEDIIDIADFVGDSYALSKQANETDAEIIVFCGVRFMAESAKILSPDKKVLLPAEDAGCPMADMVTPADIKRLRQQHPDAVVVCYVNSSYEVKAQCDVCVTSSNAVKIISALQEERVVFVPDQNLANYVARQLPGKHIIPFAGFCIVHHRLNALDVDKSRQAMPDAKLLVHPECPLEVIDKADFVGSTAQIISHAGQSPHKRFLIGTEEGILYTLKKENPDKEFYLLSPKLFCVNMKRTKLEDVYQALEREQHEIVLDKDTMDKARTSLDRMLMMA